MDRILVVAIIIVSICIAGLIGYVSATRYNTQSEPTGAPSIANEEQPPNKAPQVFEKDTQGLFPASVYIGDPELLEDCTLKFPLYALNRVEGEVTVIRYGEDTHGTVTHGTVNNAPVRTLVLDPHGNVLLQNAPLSSWQNEFPWRFSFIASMTGEHGVVVNTGAVQPMGGLYKAHLKIIVYEK
ncbi:MAG: hypothetical protein MUO97_04995 [Dehalococcoidia bacterium]|nr:hypothetical protein [Dehalococcoidia bacterium]